MKKTIGAIVNAIAFLAGIFLVGFVYIAILHYSESVKYSGDEHNQILQNQEEILEKVTLTKMEFDEYVQLYKDDKEEREKGFGNGIIFIPADDDGSYTVLMQDFDTTKIP